MSAVLLRPGPDVPRIGPMRAVRQTALLAALRGAGADAAPGLAREASGWVACADGIMVAPLVADRRRLGLCADDGAPDAVLAVAALAEIEPLLGLVEAAIGAELLPAGLAAVAPEGMVLAVESGGARLLLAVADAAVLAPVARPAAIGGIMACWHLAWRGPRLRRRPGRGDLLLGLGDAVVRLGNWQAPARVAGGEIGMTGGWRMAMDDDQPGGLDPAQLELAVSVRIEGNPIAVAELARLGAGAVLPLPGVPGQVAVTVLAGGVAIGNGTLVAIGDGHGVLFDRVFAGSGTARSAA